MKKQLLAALAMATVAAQFGCHVAAPDAQLGLGAQGPSYGLAAVPKPTPTAPGTDTLAGTGKAGLVDGAGTVVNFNSPSGLALDAAGNVYVCDTRNNCIRKIQSDGVTSTLVLTKVGAPPGARPKRDWIMSPEFIAVDATGNLYVTSTFDKGIWKITPTNSLSMWVGHETRSGDTDAALGTARFRSPKGLVFDAAGNLLVADTSCIRRVSPTGTVSTFTGQKYNPGYADTGTKPAQFRYPQGLARDAAGTLYVADSGNHCIRKVTSAGNVTTLAGIGGRSGYWDTGDSPLPKLPTSAAFDSPIGITVDGAGACYVTDSRNHCVRKVSATGVVTTFVGLNTEPDKLDGPLDVATFFQPAGLAAGTNGLLFITDRGNNKLRRLRTV